MVPATLTFALPSADIPSGPPGDEIVTAGGAAWLYPLPPFNILIFLKERNGAVIIPLAVVSS